MSGSMCNVLIVCDVRLYREGLERILHVHDRIRVIGTAASRQEVLAFLGDYTPAVILVDMATDESPLTVRQILEVAPKVKVVALAMANTETALLTCAEAGIAGYVRREGTLDELVESIEAAERGEFRCTPNHAGLLLRQVHTLATEHSRFQDILCLTARETRVLELVEAGLSNKEIACALFIEVATVKNHVHNILEKLQVKRRGEAAALLRRRRPMRDVKMPPLQQAKLQTQIPDRM